MSGARDAADARRLAEERVDAWNAHDLDRILSHRVERVELRSRKAVRLAGDGVIRGRDALHAPCAMALEGQPDLHLTLGRVYLGHDVLMLSYPHHRGVEATDTFEFGSGGDVIRLAACHAG